MLYMYVPYELLGYSVQEAKEPEEGINRLGQN